MSTSLFNELPANPSIYEDRYTVRAGRWPTAWNEAVLVLRPNGTMDDFLEYTLGLRDYAGLRSTVDKIASGESGTIEESHNTYTYDQLMSPTFKLVMPYQRSCSSWIFCLDNTNNMQVRRISNEVIHV